ncbi:MAG: GntR family transcriptional regulator [Clostridia bacterium]|nr:GntR family transcriptional regulator [Clostridia bacterium]
MNRIMVDLRSRTPIFEQIIASVKDLVIRGLLSPDENLPSVRALASELAINPNTIQKAYAELERQGVIYSLSGRGNFVASDISHIVDANRSELLKKLRADVIAAKNAGIGTDEILEILKGGEQHD